MDKKAEASVSATLPGRLIRRLHQQSNQIFMKRVKEAGFDLTPVQFSVLDALRHNPGIDQSCLAQETAKDRATTGSVADRLEQKGLVARAVSSRDKRARVLHLTEAGENLIASLEPIVVQLQREILPGLDAEEYRRFVELAAKAISFKKTER